MSDPLEILAGAVRAGACLHLVLSRPTSAAGESERVTARPIELRGTLHYQFAAQTRTQERHENLLPEDSAARVLELFPAQFQHAHLFTPEADFALKAGEGTIRVKRSPPSKAPADAAPHDRVKRYLIPENVPCPFLVEIGVMTPAGKVRAEKQHKFRQINRFLEFVDDVLPQLPPEGPLHVVDFGCGKSSLTFAVHHLLTAVRGREARIVGLDRNPHVIEECRRIAGKLGSRGLEFELGDIASHAASEKVHLAISLHACDTATDAALARAIEWKADAILAVPCCQHELAPVLANADLAPLLRHGILRERLATLVTDALRAELLEANGYRTQVLEFIDLEHTPKNLLLRAVRRSEPLDEPSPHRAAVSRLKQLLGIGRFALEPPA